jgi:methylmalonyl-CoA mutase
MPTPQKPFAAKDDWLRLIGGEAGLAALRSQTLDGLVLEPLAPRADQPEFLARSNAKAWDIRPLHALASPTATRAAIADDLAGGATSVAIKLATPGDFGLAPRYDAITAALEGVPLDKVEVSLMSGDQYFGAAQVLSALWDQTGRPAASLRAGLHADPLGTLARTGALEAGLWPSLEVLGKFTAVNMMQWPDVRLLLADGTLYHDAGASEAQELAAMLATVVEYLRVLDFEGWKARDVFRQLTVGLAADADLFATIAKLRAARQLLAQLDSSLGANGAANRIKLWVTTSRRMLTARAVHANVLRNSIAALGAVAGGADAITVLPHTWAVGAPDAAARRLARNTHHLMAEECGLARVLDPGAGSGHIAALTDAMAQKAWALFQEIEAAGGMARALLSGKVQRDVAEMAARREAEVAGGKRAITGITAFAAVETGVSAVPHPAPAPIERAETRVPALPVRRLSAALETQEQKP